MNDDISRKQALKQMGGLALGSSIIAPFLFDSEKAEKQLGKNSKKDRPQPNKPHIILLMTDQHRADALGCAGNDAIKTPNIDKLAGDGALFPNAYSSVPSCTPARSCLLTGLNPWNNGMLGYGRMARRYEYELPRMIRNGGYYTYGIGKNHWFPQKSLHGFNGTLIDESGRVEQDGFVSDYHDWFKRMAPGKDPDVTGLDWNSYHAKPYALDEDLHPTHWIGEKAVDFINNYDLEDPLYLKVSWERPHSPYDPPQRFLDMYKGVDISPPTVGREGSWDHQFANIHPDNANAALGNFGTDQAIKSRRHYYANITFVDEQIGQIIDTLKYNGMYENSIICFCADHGDMLGDHYHWRKTYAYEGSSNIPFVLKWPDEMKNTIQRGTMRDDPIGLQDVLPTFLQASGQKVPDDMDGMSLLQLVKDNAEGWRNYIGMEHATEYFSDNYWAAVTNGHYKYIWFFRSGEERFFDLDEDPGETQNLAYTATPDYKLKSWRNWLVTYLEERGPGFVKDGQLVKRQKTMLYSPNYPDEKEQQLGYWKSKEKQSFTIKT